MLRTLLTRRWLTWLLVAVLFGIACFFLGRWQWHSHEGQQAKIAAIEANYGAPARPAGQALPAGASMSTRSQWTHVTLTGTYEPRSTFLVRGRPGPGDANGYEVLVPLRTGSGTWLVDRGWVRAGDTATQVPAFGAPATERVTVTGWLRSPERDRDKTLPRGQLASIYLRPVSEQLGRPVEERAYVVLGTESPAATEHAQPVTPPRPHEDLGPHQAYAYQWWCFMPAGVIFVVLQARREHRGTGTAPDRPQRARRTRIWDEEDW